MERPTNTIISILGTAYTVIFDEELTDADGICDKTSKVIKVCKTLYDETPQPGRVQYIRNHANKVLRHEVIHAFRNESGLLECASDSEEQWVDWIAYQFSKLSNAFDKLGVS